MKKKLLATILATTLTATMLSGCGEAKTEAPAPAETKTEEAAPQEEASPAETAESEVTGEIHYAYWQDALTPYLEESAKIFEETYPGTKIILEPTAWGEYWTKLETAASGGSVADVFQLNGPNVGKYASAGVVLPIDEFLASSDLDLSNYPAALNDLYTVEGKQYGIAMDYDTIGLWYNKELFDAKGIAYPNENWTWDDLVEAAKAITDEATGTYGITADYADQGGFYNTVPLFGGYIISEDKKTSGFSLPETKAGIQCWVDLMKAGYSPSQASLTENPNYVQFMSGKVGMVMAGDWFATTFASDETFKDKCDVTYIPMINGKRTSVIHGKANCISSATPSVEAAWKWVEFLAGDKANEILGKSGAAIPSHKDYSALYFEQFPQYNMAIFADEAQNSSYPYPTSKTAAEWGDIMWNELISAYSLEVSVDEACESIASQMNDLLATE